MGVARLTPIYWIVNSPPEQETKENTKTSLKSAQRCVCGLDTTRVVWKRKMIFTWHRPKEEEDNNEDSRQTQKKVPELDGAYLSFKCKLCGKMRDEQ